MLAESQELVIESYLEKDHIVQFVDYAALVILIYDYFLTFGSEITFVWTRGSWNLSKVLFFLVRYPTFIFIGITFYVNTTRSIPVSSCPSWLNAAFYSSICVLTLTEFLFGLRVWAMWGRSKKVAICLVVTTGVLVAFGLYKAATVRETQSDFELEYYERSRHLCPPQFSGVDQLSGDSVITFGFVMIAVYEFVALVLILIQASRHGWLGIHGSGSRFINRFISQGVAYNCLILVASTANIIVRYKLSSAYVNFLIDLQPVLHSILTSRMMLYLRKKAFSSQTFTPNDTLTGLVAFDAYRSESRCPAASCPQISVGFLDVGDPLTLEEQATWKEEV